MASLLHKHHVALPHEFRVKDLVKYVCIAVVALLGIAGILQSISGISQSNGHTEQSGYAEGVYTTR